MLSLFCSKSHNRHLFLCMGLCLGLSPIFVVVFVRTSTSLQTLYHVKFNCEKVCQSSKTTFHSDFIWYYVSKQTVLSLEKVLIVLWGSQHLFSLNFVRLHHLHLALKLRPYCNQCLIHAIFILRHKFVFESYYFSIWGYEPYFTTFDINLFQHMMLQPNIGSLTAMLHQ